MRTLSCDVLIIGSGAAGGTLAATLSELTSLRVVVLEKGGHFTKRFFNQREWDMRVLYADEGTRSTADGGIVVRGGECVGGGTTVNVMLCFSPVPKVWDRWKRLRGLTGFTLDGDPHEVPTGGSPASSARGDYGVPDLTLTNAAREVRARIGVHAPLESEINRNNRAFRRGCAALGVRTKPFELNMRGCIGCGFCGQGCSYDAKQGTMITYLADARARGVPLVHHCTVEALRIERRAGRPVAVGALAHVRETTPGSEPNSIPPGDLRIDARLVVCCAGAIETPVLWKRSDHPDPYDRIGRGLVLHPSLPIIGRMQEEIAGHRGIEGTVYSDHFFDEHGFYFECLFGHPLYGSALLPGAGPDHFEWMLDYRRLAGFGVMLVDTAEAANRVAWNRRTGKRSIHYRLSPADAARLRLAAERGIEIMFAAGAHEVLLPSDEPLGPLPTARFRAPAEAVHCRNLAFLPHQTVITSAHSQATMKMGEDASNAMLTSRCESHFVDRLLAIDASSFPESCGANPMISIMSLARYQGRRIAGELARYGL